MKRIKSGCAAAEMCRKCLKRRGISVRKGMFSMLWQLKRAYKRKYENVDRF